MKLNSPFTPLDATGSGLEAIPPSLEPLRERMADYYGVQPHQLMVTRGASHALEIVLRRLRINGYDSVMSGPDTYINDLCDVYNLEVKAPPERGPIGKSCGMYRIENPRQPDGKAWDIIAARSIAVEIFPAILVIDESLFDAATSQSLTCLIESEANVVVLKSLSYLFGLTGARVGALIAGPKTLQGLLKYCEPHPLATPSIRAAEKALSPSRAALVLERIALLQAEQGRLRSMLNESDLLDGAEINEAPFALLKPKNLLQTQTTLKRFGISAQNTASGLLVAIGTVSDNDKLLAALGIKGAGRPARIGEALRDTKETKISVSVNLDQAKPVKVSTGIGYFDHMLDQVATHGGFSLNLACEGDLEIDAHHTIEDVMLALGQAIKSALGDRMGMARFGFTLPMDETEARVSIDLGGRPFCVFNGEFKTALLGDFPTEMTAHAFRSLSETLGASIHIEVKGENDHHKVEACFKALGRALRQAIRVEGTDMPSTKGMLA